MSDEPDPIPWPLTLDAAVDTLLSRMKDADKGTVRDTPEEQLIRFHFPWGMGIRNAFGLWQGNTRLLESCGGGHPDSASMVISRAVWKRLQETERDE